MCRCSLHTLVFLINLNKNVSTGRYSLQILVHLVHLNRNTKNNVVYHNLIKYNQFCDTD